MGLISSFLEIFRVEQNYDKKKGIYLNGEFNDYPEKVERLANNSVTARRCVSLYSSYIAGKGVSAYNDVIVNKKKNITLGSFISRIASTKSLQNGVFIHVTYNADLSINNIDELPYSHCRIGEEDDDKYSGKILVKDWLDKKNKKEPVIFDVYNNNKDVILSQIEHAGGIAQYKGQVLFINPSVYKYPLSRIDPVINDVSSEYQVSVFKNVSLRKGFFGKTLVITPPFVDGTMEKGSEEYHEAETERNNFKNTIQDFIGAENASGVLHLEMELDNQDIDKVIMFKNIETNIDDKMFAHTEESIQSNIAMSFGIPQGLILQSDGALFASSGESLYQMKLQVQEESTQDRKSIQDALNELLPRMGKGIESVEIESLIEPKEEEDVNIEE